MYIVIAKHIARSNELWKQKRKIKNVQTNEAHKAWESIWMLSLQLDMVWIHKMNIWFFFMYFSFFFSFHLLLLFIVHRDEQFNSRPNEILHFAVNINVSTVILLRRATAEQDSHHIYDNEREQHNSIPTKAYFRNSVDGVVHYYLERLNLVFVT